MPSCSCSAARRPNARARHPHRLRQGVPREPARAAHAPHRPHPGAAARAGAVRSAPGAADPQQRGRQRLGRWRSPWRTPSGRRICSPSSLRRRHGHAEDLTAEGARRAVASHRYQRVLLVRAEFAAAPGAGHAGGAGVVYGRLRCRRRAPTPSALRACSSSTPGELARLRLVARGTRSAAAQHPRRAGHRRVDPGDALGAGARDAQLPAADHHADGRHVPGDRRHGRGARARLARAAAHRAGAARPADLRQDPRHLRLHVADAHPHGDRVRDPAALHRPGAFRHERQLQSLRSRCG